MLVQAVMGTGSTSTAADVDRESPFYQDVDSLMGLSGPYGSLSIENMQIGSKNLILLTQFQNNSKWISINWIKK